MTFAQARAVSEENKLHVRRESWPGDKWFIVWRGTWDCWIAGARRRVRAIDYGEEDLRATDWTTIPAVLEACPVTPTEPGGGGPPGPDFPGFPPVGGVPAGFPPPPGSPPPIGGDIPPPLPPPNDDATALTVTFDDITPNPDLSLDPDNGPQGVNLNRSFTLHKVGPTTWKKVEFPLGSMIAAGVEDHPCTWTITATLSLGVPPTWDLVFAGISDFGEIYLNATSAEKGTPMNNIYGSGSYFGGTGTVS